jgi:predicted kinase
MVRTAAELGHSVIVDETNLTARRRREWLSFLEKTAGQLRKNIRTVFVWFTETEKNLENRMKDPRGLSRRKWASVVAFMKKKIEEPCLAEGCHRIIKVARSERSRR